MSASKIHLERLSSLATAAGSMTRLAFARANAAGIPIKPLCSAAGLTLAQVEDRHARLNVQSQIKFLDLVAESLQDEFLGFHLAQEFELREVGLLYYVLASSPTFDEALQRTLRYSGIVNEGIRSQYHAGENFAVTFKYFDVARSTDRHQIEFWLAAFTRICRHITNSHLRASGVKFMHRRKGRALELQTIFWLQCGVWS
jgi:hypothetical protein